MTLLNCNYGVIEIRPQSLSQSVISHSLIVSTVSAGKSICCLLINKAVLKISINQVFVSDVLTSPMPLYTE